MNLINRLLLASAMLACIPLQAIARDSVVVFNEIHYHPANNASSLEYVELYNQLPVEVDLSNWRIVEETRLLALDSKQLLRDLAI